MASILIAEDNEYIRIKLTRFLEAAGHTLTMCETADEALKAANIQQFDLLLSDYNMPGKNGVELVRDIAQSMHPCPAIIHTSKAEHTLELENPGHRGYDALKKAGIIRAYVQKEVDVMKLLPAIETVLTQPKRSVRLGGEGREHI